MESHCDAGGRLSIRFEARNGNLSSRAISIFHLILTISISPGVVVVSQTVRLPDLTSVVVRWRGRAAYKWTDPTLKSFSMNTVTIVVVNAHPEQLRVVSLSSFLHSWKVSGCPFRLAYPTLRKTVYASCNHHHFYINRAIS
jgi:hypothetical protein